MSFPMGLACVCTSKSLIIQASATSPSVHPFGEWHILPYNCKCFPSYPNMSMNYEHSRTLFQNHESLKPHPFITIVGHMLLPSAHMVIMAVVFSRSSPPCTC